MDFDKHMIETVAQGRSKRAAPNLFFRHTDPITFS